MWFVHGAPLFGAHERGCLLKLPMQGYSSSFRGATLKFDDIVPGAEVANFGAFRANRRKLKRQIRMNPNWQREKSAMLMHYPFAYVPASLSC